MKTRIILSLVILFNRIVGKGAGTGGNKDFPHQPDYLTA